MSVSPLGKPLRSRGLTSTLVRVAAGLSIASLGIAALPHGEVHATVAGCRSDPIVLINGLAVDIVSTLYANPSAIKELDYTITVPNSTLLGPINLTPGLGFPEKVKFAVNPSMRWGTLLVQATVVTQPGVAPFSTTVSVSVLLSQASMSGMSNAVVSATLGNLLML